ncbi:biosynthetic-type acetolactate synthase large subunit [Salipaludibacillus agaradhaerens]|uniref:biosynthetic-type acetolactate synthase large subunit n=1 Tax=Salipaludibacillus agaradhaerens TaxID=76935 RepID=UPI0021517415|nr:biosynthetic-type acetolactate synthase large subunit [Salipaludibacillus agaradhaerens]MCR6118125.1 biosynthetic-type acetolactate synthase large subunit [Salipaludibacillus agaradhaerens]UJW57251.1 biosynthetic-type acetolactate synthase large subunit [Bacillus sp. A116_S68]
MNVETKPKTQPKTAVKTGADILIDSLIEQKVDTIFGYPGGAVLPIYDALYRSDGDFEHILTRHEQGAIHAAEGYARVSGRPGVVLATSGPGATNLITGIADAMMDSLPLVIITGQVATSVTGTDAFQEADVMGITTPITKHNYQVQSSYDIPRIIKEAFHIASTGRPGPVVVDIPKDISANPCLKVDESDFHLPGYQPTIKPNPLQIKKLTEALKKSKKPLILTGAGVIHGKASDLLLDIVEAYELPVTSTLLGLGAFPGDHKLFLGMAGMHGTYTSNMAISECDLLINIGARFDDRLTGNLEHFATNATVAHIDIDPAEIGKNVTTHIPIVSDSRAALEELKKQVNEKPDHGAWMTQLKENKASYPLWYNNPSEDMIPQWLIKSLHDATNGDAIVTTDVGQHQMWTAQYYAFAQPNKWVTSGGLGTMGFGFPAAIGAQLAAPEEPVVAVVGDGGFQMTLQELSVLQERGLPVKIIIVNNGALGMVRQWQEAFYDKRYSESIVSVQPDFVKLAESYNIRGMKFETQKQFNDNIKEIMDYNGPVLLDCRVLQQENVYPMVPPGKGIHEMIGVKP